MYGSEKKCTLSFKFYSRISCSEIISLVYIYIFDFSFMKMKFGKIEFKKDLGYEIIIKLHYVRTTVKKLKKIIDKV